MFFVKDINFEEHAFISQGLASIGTETEAVTSVSRIARPVSFPVTERILQQPADQSVGFQYCPQGDTENIEDE